MAKLTIQDISKILTEKSGLQSRQASKFATEIFSIILERLQEGEQVKVKGLGTFKVVTVEARESVNIRTGERIMIEEHDKVTFTPDTLMRELVNKPFSQFETVVLNDGVVFDDETSEEKEEPLTDEDENLPLEKRPLVDYVTDEDSDEEQEPDSGEESSVNEESDEEDNTVIETPEEEPIVDESDNADSADDSENADASDAADNTDAEDSADDDVVYDDDEEANKHSWVKWLLAILAVLALMAASAYCGYKYAMSEMTPVLDMQNEKDAQSVKTVLEQPIDTVTKVKDTVTVSEPMEASEPVKQSKPVEEVKPMEIAKPDKVAKAKEVVEASDPYAAKDERVRLGAYRIVGTLNVITVQPGQTFYSICKGNLGPDMECYVEVYNNFPRNPQIKVGQKIKIPKLELKKKRKR